MSLNFGGVGGLGVVQGRVLVTMYVCVLMVVVLVVVVGGCGGVVDR